MATHQEDEPDAYLRMGRIAIVLAAGLVALGLSLIATFKEPGRTTIAVAGTELGSACFTVALIELLFLRGVERFKERMTSDIRAFKAEMRASDERQSAFFAEMDTRLESIKAQAHRINVERDLALLRQGVEDIHRAVDPAYRDIVDRMRLEANKPDVPNE